MSQILNLANLVADKLHEYHAEVRFAPEFDLRNLETMRIVVAPHSTEYKALTRTAHEELIKIQIGVLKRCSEDELSAMLPFVETLGLSFLNKKLGGAMCVGVAYDPIYSAEHLRERRQFTSVIELTFKLVL